MKLYTKEQALRRLQTESIQNKQLGTKAAIVFSRDQENFDIRWFRTESGYRADLNKLPGIIAHGILK